MNLLDEILNEYGSKILSKAMDSAAVSLPMLIGNELSKKQKVDFKAIIELCIESEKIADEIECLWQPLQKPMSRLKKLEKKKQAKVIDFWSKKALG